MYNVLIKFKDKLIDTFCLLKKSKAIRNKTTNYKITHFSDNKKNNAEIKREDICLKNRIKKKSI